MSVTLQTRFTRSSTEVALPLPILNISPSIPGLLDALINALVTSSMYTKSRFDLRERIFSGFFFTVATIKSEIKRPGSSKIPYGVNIRKVTAGNFFWREYSSTNFVCETFVTL